MQHLCPCGSDFPYSNCCEPIINASKVASTAQQLMRSRYAAFTTANVDYLMRSHSAKTRPIGERKSIERWAKSVQWMGLVILNTEAGEANDETGTVEFKAMYIEKGKLQQIHEKSLFRKENHQWLYVSGVHF